ncbi:hypothetical protein D9M68_214320 [compost metagenome]
MIELLRLGGVDDWANIFERLRDELAVNPEDVESKILSMYGGMGSLNDLVLYKNGRPLLAENNEFDALRTRLYESCQKIRMKR